MIPLLLLLVLLSPLTTATVLVLVLVVLRLGLELRAPLQSEQVRFPGLVEGLLVLLVRTLVGSLKPALDAAALASGSPISSCSSPAVVVKAVTVSAGATVEGA